MNVEIDGNRMRELRREKAMERKELERVSGVHWTTIARIETVQKVVRLSTAKKLAAALGVECSEFIGGEVRNRGKSKSTGVCG